MFNASHFRPAQTATALSPLRAWEYLRLRREAAGLTIEQLVSRLTSSERRAEQARRLIMRLESPGASARDDAVIARIGRVVPLDVTVYRQLADDPIERHPSVCRRCGCSDFDRCSCSTSGRACSWASSHLCTRCERSGL
ncbi:hypothetical protein [uncultured Sphingomonas sp.]|uniref:hypothetical protein n=1 Tax=uncultured Sphingomonas sp. TaxID=158754 RepID=UPI0030F63C6E